MKPSKTSMNLKVHQYESLTSQMLKLFVRSRGSALRQMYQILPQSTHRVEIATFWRIFRHDGKIRPAWWSWGVHALPLSLYLPSPEKWWCTLQLRGQIYVLPLFLIYPYMYSVGITVRNTLSFFCLLTQFFSHFFTTLRFTFSLHLLNLKINSI